MKIPLLLSLLFLAAFLLGACGNDTASEPAATVVSDKDGVVTPTPTPTPEPPPFAARVDSPMLAGVAKKTGAGRAPGPSAC